ALSRHAREPPRPELLVARGSVTDHRSATERHCGWGSRVAADPPRSEPRRQRGLQLHLEDGARAVIVEGLAGPTTPPEPTLAARPSTAYRKYEEKGYTPAPDSWEGE